MSIQSSAACPACCFRAVSSCLPSGHQKPSHSLSATNPDSHFQVLLLDSIVVIWLTVIPRYVFLVERAHAIRAPYMRRRSDFIWLVGIFFIAAGFGSIAICGFIWPISDMSKVDGRCRIGLPLKVTIPLLTFDVIINTALTGIFIYLLRPLLRWTLRPRTILNEPERPRTGKRIRNMLGGSNAPSTSATITDFYRINHTLHKSIEVLLWKTLIGCVLVMLPTVGNLAALYIMKGRELGWLCLTICSCDGMYSSPFGGMGKRAGSDV